MKIKYLTQELFLKIRNSVINFMGEIRKIQAFGEKKN